MRKPLPIPGLEGQTRSALILGLTGSVGSGKTFTSSLLSEAKAKVVCADQIARELVGPGGEALREIEHAFGPAVLLPDGSLNRAELARRVFQSPVEKTLLESILHPRVRQKEFEQVALWKDWPLVVLDVPLLFETGLDAYCDKTVVVAVTEPVRLARLQQDRGMTTDQVHARLATQMPQEEKIAKADLVIDNSGTKQATLQQVAALLRRLFPEGIPSQLQIPAALEP